MEQRGGIPGLLLVIAATLCAERLPVKTYTTSDGLAHDITHRVRFDRRGFLWICTEEGLSRFDGYQFTNYSTAQGLPHRRVVDFLETRRGQYWVATSDGVCRFDPAAAQKFTVFRPGSERLARSIRVLFEDRAGTVWCGTWRGLFKLVEGRGGPAFEEVEIGLPKTSAYSAGVATLLEDRRGSLWIGAASGLFRRWPDGRIEYYSIQHGLTSPDVGALTEDRTGRLWVTTYNSGLCRLVADPSPGRPVVASTYSPGTNRLFQASDGRLWAAGWNGSVREILLGPQDDRVTFRDYTQAVGSRHDIGSIAEDRNGDLWLGTGNGVIRVARRGFTAYGAADGLELPTNGNLFADQSGEICGHWKGVNCFDGQRFTPVWPRAIQADPPGWGPHRAFQDRQGDWWFGTEKGLYRFAKPSTFAALATARPKAVYTRKDGLAGDHIFSLHEDARGDLWIGLADAPVRLCRWTRASGTFGCYTEGVGFLNGTMISAYAEDKAGQLWMGLYQGGLARHRDGRFTFFPPGQGPSAGPVMAIHPDRANRLWVGSENRGLVRIDDPAADHPVFRPYSTEHGIPSNSIHGITEDAWGRIYLATRRGVVRLDPETGQVRQYTTDSGLPENQVTHASSDRHGALWFETRSGPVRLIPEPDRPAPPPSIWILGLRIAGRPYPVSDIGEAGIRGIETDAGQNHFQIEFAGLGAAPGERLRYQYKLEGSEAGWSPPADQRTVHLAGLAPGSYRFLVRAVSTDGSASPSPALLSFTVHPPVWRRAWFLALAAAILMLAGYQLYRYRVSRLIELERVRTRIATDLHDDIGSSLSQIAILSEVTREQIRSGSDGAAGTAGQIAETARSMVDAMSDIVWSIDPRRDDLTSLMQRVGKFASSVLDTRGITWSLEMPDHLGRVKLGAEQRRQVYLILKEAVHNAARHAEARAVTLRLAVADHHLLADVADNGRGFAPDGARPGYGLDSMRSRAAQLQGQLRIHSAPGEGTRISLRVSL